MAKKYVLQLTTDERAAWNPLVRQGKVAGWKRQRAQALLQCDQGPDGRPGPTSGSPRPYGCTPRSLEAWPKQAVEDGPLSLRPRKPRARPPRGYARGTLRRLAERLVELAVVDAISHEAVRRALKEAT